MTVTDQDLLIQISKGVATVEERTKNTDKTLSEVGADVKTLVAKHNTLEGRVRVLETKRDSTTFWVRTAIGGVLAAMGASIWALFTGKH